ncbi:MAG: 2,3-diphosphoglycerate-dependent phosphoglycerate mutase [Bacteroidales bacterium]|jgi:2,3-bisphosphoglycerate-dependent phosphoglycerate mutase|nr:2,3-diphosphoglycerate-dependent phosphoglycerate mutase [Bacteroidales bacterium]
MKRLILVRHGQSQWNELNLFTGWTDVDLTQRGIKEAYDAGLTLKNAGYKPEVCFTSYLKRAVKTLNQVLDAMDMDYLPVEKSWRLNEKHYGILQGKNKKEMVEKYGDQQIHQWRRGYACPPPVLEEEAAKLQRNDNRYAELSDSEMPYTESLKDCIDRLMPFYQKSIKKAFDVHNEVIVVAHGNSLRGIVKTIKGISDDDIADLNLPTAIPYIFELDDSLHFLNDFFLADKEALDKATAEVANQSKK